MTTRRSTKEFLAAAAIAIFGAAAAGSAAPSEAPRQAGTKEIVLAHLGAFEFAPDDTAFQWAPAGLGGTRGIAVGTPGVGGFLAYPHVPTGALLQSLELDYCIQPGGSVTMRLDDCDYLGGDCHTLSEISSGFGGCFFSIDDLSAKAYTVHNSLRQLILGAIVSGSGSASLNGAFVGYRLQLSPPPAAATFGDVPPSHPFFRAIEALAGAGITNGCGSGNFCPEQPVTRGEMAKFLANALGLDWPE